MRFPAELSPKHNIMGLCNLPIIFNSYCFYRYFLYYFINRSRVYKNNQIENQQQIKVRLLKLSILSLNTFQLML